MQAPNIKSYLTLSHHHVTMTDNKHCECRHDPTRYGIVKLVHQCHIPTSRVENYPPLKFASRLERLPCEISSQIYQLACLDFGETGAALSLVSKTIREDAAPWRFQSIGIFGLVNMVRIKALLDSLPPSLRRVRHLFATSESFPNPTESSSSSSSSPPSDMTGYCDCNPQTGDGPVSRLLRLVSNTLWTLSLSLPFYHHDHEPVSILFPHLYSLDLDYRLLVLDSTLFPRLQHVHVDRSALVREWLSTNTALLNLPLVRIVYSKGERWGPALYSPRDVSNLIAMGYSEEELGIVEPSGGGLILKGNPSSDPLGPPNRTRLSTRAVQQVVSCLWPDELETPKALSATEQAIALFPHLVQGDGTCCLTPHSRTRSKALRQIVLDDLWT